MLCFFATEIFVSPIQGEWPVVDLGKTKLIWFSCAKTRCDVTIFQKKTRDWMPVKSLLFQLKKEFSRFARVHWTEVLTK